MRIVMMAVVVAGLAAPAWAQGPINADGQRSGVSGREAGGQAGGAGPAKPNVEGAGNGAGRTGSLDGDAGAGRGMPTGAASPMSGGGGSAKGTGALPGQPAR